MRMRLVCAGLGLMLLPVSGASAADTFDAGRPIGAPTLVAGGVAWGASDGRGSHLRFRDATGATRSLADVEGTTDDEGFYGTVRAIATEAAAGNRLAYRVSTYDNAASKYDGGDGLVNSRVSVLTIGGATQSLASCGYGLGTPTVGLGDDLTVVGGCLPQAFTDAPANVPPVSVNGAAVGTGGAVQAAGPFAAWNDGKQVVVYRPSAGAAVSTMPGGGDWGLLNDGSVAVSKGYVRAGTPVDGGGRLEVTPVGGTATLAATEPGGIFGLRSGGAAVVFETSTGDGELTVVVRRGGERFEVGRLWWLSPYSPSGFSTDGTRVAFLSARCGGVDLTVATIGEPVVDRRVAPCPVSLQPTGSMTKRRLIPAVACDPSVPPVTCAGSATVRAGGRVLARGVFRETQPNINSAPLRLTAAGRRVVAKLGRRQKLRARVTVTRDAGTAQPTSSASVTFSR